MNTYTISLQDDADELGLNRCEVTVQFDYDIRPGDPAKVVVDPCRVIKVFGAAAPSTLDAMEEVQQWAERTLMARRYWIEKDILWTQPTAEDYL